MKIDASPPCHLTYCMNVHPGETWDDCVTAIRNHVVPLRERMAPGRPFGLGLRLSNAATLEATPEALSAMQALFDEHDLYLLTVNAFPYGTFHGERVKEAVYHPDWRTEERRDYTIRVADISARLASPGQTVSISTVPGSYGAWISSDEDIANMVQQLMEVVAHLAHIEREQGCHLTLGLEPEPDCFLETTADALAFFGGPIRRIGIPYLDKLLNTNMLCYGSLIARHLGICVDTCHLALQFESVDQSLRALFDAGILISKVQLSSALHAQNTPEARDALRAFCDPVYLHQVKARTADEEGSRSYSDLDIALDTTTANPAETWRIHFHVPLYFDSYGSLGSTATDLSPSFFKMLKDVGVSHLEIETYTFDVLPPGLRAAGIDESLAREYAWIRSRL